MLFKHKTNNILYVGQAGIMISPMSGVFALRFAENIAAL